MGKMAEWFEGRSSGFRETSNPELRTSDRAFLAYLARHAPRFMDAGGLFQHSAKRLQHQPESISKIVPPDNGFRPLLSKTGFNQSLLACNQLKFQVMYSDWDSSSPCRADPVQKPRRELPHKTALSRRA